MSDKIQSGDDLANLSRDEMMSVLFAQMVMQQSNLAMMLMGKVPHPESGQSMRDLEAARLFVDQLEMLEVKTKGNLNPQEAALLKQSLMALRMAFVETVEKPEPAGQSAAVPDNQTAKPSADEPLESQMKTTTEESKAPGAEEDSRKKFSKKY